MTVVCCVCGKERKAGDWVRETNKPKPGVAVSHGYCPACLTEVKSKFLQAVAAK